jgi:hypothetical protein
LVALQYDMKLNADSGRKSDAVAAQALRGALDDAESG